MLLDLKGVTSTHQNASYVGLMFVKGTGIQSSNWITVGQGPIVLAVGAGGGCLNIFSLIYQFSFLSLSLSGRPPDID